MPSFGDFKKHSVQTKPVKHIGKEKEDAFSAMKKNLSEADKGVAHGLEKKSVLDKTEGRSSVKKDLRNN